ncbi:hypothetical protein Pelo_11238 [Pelomyxa schiedti]|nr:hypothetical protein Pelo_11238 [Pelomyxa schiedti]
MAGNNNGSLFRAPVFVHLERDGGSDDSSDDSSGDDVASTHADEPAATTVDPSDTANIVSVTRLKPQKAFPLNRYQQERLDREEELRNRRNRFVEVRQQEKQYEACKLREHKLKKAESEYNKACQVMRENEKKAREIQMAEQRKAFAKPRPNPAHFAARQIEYQQEIQQQERLEKMDHARSLELQRWVQAVQKISLDNELKKKRNDDNKAKLENLQRLVANTRSTQLTHPPFSVAPFDDSEVPLPLAHRPLLPSFEKTHVHQGKTTSSCSSDEGPSSEEKGPTKSIQYMATDNQVDSTNQDQPEEEIDTLILPENTEVDSVASHTEIHCSTTNKSRPVGHGLTIHPIITPVPPCTNEYNQMTAPQLGNSEPVVDTVAITSALQDLNQQLRDFEEQLNRQISEVTAKASVTPLISKGSTKKVLSTQAITHTLLPPQQLQQTWVHPVNEPLPVSEKHSQPNGTNPLRVEPKSATVQFATPQAAFCTEPSREVRNRHEPPIKPVEHISGGTHSDTLYPYSVGGKQEATPEWETFPPTPFQIQLAELNLPPFPHQPRTQCDPVIAENSSTSLQNATPFPPKKENTFSLHQQPLPGYPTGSNQLPAAAIPTGSIHPKPVNDHRSTQRPSTTLPPKPTAATPTPAIRPSLQPNTTNSQKAPPHAPALRLQPHPHLRGNQFGPPGFFAQLHPKTPLTEQNQSGNVGNKE